ncbi:hypothetical protein [Pseudoxanthomonas composti]|uniref:Uncharacterized protein n=1 Tax=Pseudoxanthomonas composti TaxID=2137479 RepID=A0A4Q1JV88_9GAMM|nr:hypothetical protein [Pseudoxanthomonas composti]RXR05973.1 hypothetical protein EPA99_08980 [Pseudoxanthomonas composti]
MPAISVLLEDEHLATVNTRDYDVVLVSIHGATTDDEFATLDMSGGTYPESGESTHLNWIDSLELQPGQRIEVRLQEEGDTSPQGKTFEELFPGEPLVEKPVDFGATEAIFSELRGKPPRRAQYTFRLLVSSGTAFAGKTSLTDHAFGFSLVWNSYHPQRTSCSLYTCTIDELVSRAPLRHFVREYIQAPSCVSLEVDVEPVAQVGQL